jgi:uncharacterized protein
VVKGPSRIAADNPWYDLFSRGARDWLRHNQKVREAVKGSLPNLIAGPDVLTNGANRTVLVPVRLLEHARFRLAEPDTQAGAGQGRGEPGDLLRPSQPQGGRDEGEGAGGNEDGEVKFVLELKIDDIMDWLWDELRLPDLKPKQNTTLDDAELVREGWDKRGARSRLDRRRTVKEAIKRRAMQEDPVAFTDDDLRFRQLARRRKPSTSAVVIFALDVSGSMGEAQRRLAKSFFFFALQGIRRQYAKVETVFIAHTVHAWEFSEEQFFHVSASGGTVASSAFNLALDLHKTRFDPGRYNSYLFYASDGENFMEDRTPAAAALTQLASLLNYAGYAEILSGAYNAGETEMRRLFADLESRGLPVGTTPVARFDDIWVAIRRFFSQQAGEQAAA